MSLIVLAGIVGGVAAAGALAVGVRWAVRRRSPALPEPSEAAPRALPAAPEPASPSLEPFGLALGDVIMLREGEAWLTGALWLKDSGEDEVGLFFTNETPDGDMLMVRPAPRRALFLMRAIELPAATLAPHTLEHERDVFTRKRSIPVILDTHGKGCPPVGDGPCWTWFESPGGDVITSLQWASGTLAWRGREVDEGSTLRLAAGQATFRT